MSKEKHITKTTLVKIIREELAKANDVDDAIERSTVIKVASDLMKAVNVFREKATESMKSHLMSLDEIYSELVKMTNEPHSFVDSQVVQSAPVKRTFKAADNDVIK